MSDEMVLRCENCNEPNTALDLEMSVYCHKCGRMLPIERYYENLGTADKPSWGRPLWQARIEDAAHAAGAAAEKARVVAVIEAEWQRFTDKSGTGTDAEWREMYGYMADAVASVLEKVKVSP